MTGMIQVLQIQEKINEALISKEMSLCKDRLLLKDFYLFSFFCYRVHFYFIQWEHSESSTRRFFHSSEGTASTEQRFSSQSPPPSYFPTSHDPPCAAETRGKVAAQRRLDAA